MGRFEAYDDQADSPTSMAGDPSILLVDDDESTLDTLRRIFERQGYEVETTRTAEEALHKGAARFFNVALLDVRLPDGKGIDLVAALKDRHPEMGCIIATGYASAQTAVRALKDGAAAYVTKPLDMDEVLAEVRQIVERQRLVVEKLAAERRLRRSEERYRRLFEGIPLGLYRTTADGRILHANQALVDLLGYPDRQTLMAVDVRDLYVDPQDRERERALLEAQGGIVRGFEMQLRRRDGSVIWVRDTVRVDRDVQGRPVTYQGSLEDITEQKRAEEALRRSEEQYRAVFETTGTATAILEEDTTISLVNAEYERLSGYAKEEVEGKMSWTESVAPGDLEKMMRRHRQRRVDPDAPPRRYEFQFVDAEGRVKDVLAHIDLIPGTKKSVASLLDITEWKRAQERIREHSKYMEALLEVDRAISSTLDLDRVLGLVLEKLEQVLPYDSASVFLLSDGVAKLTAVRGHPEPERAMEVAFPVESDELASKMLNRERPLVLTDAQADDRFQDLGGTDYVRSWIGVPLMAEGALIGFLTVDHSELGVYDETSAAKAEAFARQAAVAIDNARLFEQAQREIAQRRRTEKALERELGRASLLNEIARAMTARQDLDSLLRVVVQRLEEDFTDLASVWLREGESDVFTLASAGDRGQRALRHSGLPQQVAVPSETADELMRGEIRYLADLTLLETPILKRMAERLDVRSAVVAPLTAQGALLGLVVSGRRELDGFAPEERDFLHSLALHVGLAVRQAQLRQNLEEAYQDLRQTQRAMMRQQRLRALGEMASGIAHDINNAISPVPLYTGLIRAETDLGERSRAHLSNIETAISDVEETVARMRQFYRDRGQEAFAPVEMNQAARQAVELTRPRWRDVAQERGATIELQTDLQDGLPPIVGIEGEIRQAVVNLILNAIDAMPDGGELGLRTRMGTGDPPHVVLAVSDSGVGMDEETQERCFEPFFSTKGDRGSGMGLATVYGTMKRHGGDVQLESALGEGTTVRLLFPVTDVAEGDGVEEAARPLSPMRILCVDDEPAVREAVKEALEGQGHTVELAEGGASGLEAFRAAQQRAEPFDVVITDLGMPEVSGREVARGVKTEAPETPVILLTGWGRRLRAQDEVPAAVDLMLGKPPTIEGLTRALAQVTSGR